LKNIDKVKGDDPTHDDYLGNCQSEKMQSNVELVA